VETEKADDDSKAPNLPNKQNSDTQYEIIRDEAQLQRMVSDITDAGSFSFDTETTSTHPMSADLVGVSFSISQGQGWYIPVGHLNDEQLALEKFLL